MHLPLNVCVAPLLLAVFTALVAQGQRPSTFPPALQPSPSGELNEASTTPGHLSREAWQHRIRNKNTRLYLLQQHIMNNIQLLRKPNVTEVMTPEQIHQIQEQFNRSQGNDHHGNIAGDDDDDDRRRFSVLRPNCPPTTDRREMVVWSTPGKYRLHFRLDSQARGLPTRTKVKSAILRLHRKPVIIRNKQNKQVVGRRQPTGTGAPTGAGAAGSRNDLETNKRIRPMLNLTISEYMSPVKYNIPEFKKAVKTINIRQKRSGWVIINIKSVVRQWYRRPKMNFGLEVQLINEQNESVDPWTIFDGYTCNTRGGSKINNQDFLKSNSTSSGKVVESLEISEDPMMYPNLGVVTVQVPRLHRRRIK